MSEKIDLEEIRRGLIELEKKQEEDERDPEHVWTCEQCGAKIKGFEWYMQHWRRHFEPTYEQLHRRMTI